MMERAERQVVTILEHGALNGSHATTNIGDGEFLRRGPHTAAALSHNLWRYLVGHIGGKCAGTLTVAEHMHARKAHATA